MFVFICHCFRKRKNTNPLFWNKNTPHPHKKNISVGMRTRDFSLILFAFFVLLFVLQWAMAMELIAHALRSDEMFRCAKFWRVEVVAFIRLPWSSSVTGWGWGTWTSGNPAGRICKLSFKEASVRPVTCVVCSSWRGREICSGRENIVRIPRAKSRVASLARV